VAFGRWLNVVAPAEFLLLPETLKNSAESLDLEPFKNLFQWCPMACNGYARVDSNNLSVPPVYVFSKGMGGF